MKKYLINGKKFAFDDTKKYYDFMLENGERSLFAVDWNMILDRIARKQISEESLEKVMILLDRWILDVPRKRVLRLMRKEGLGVLTDEFLFDDESDERVEEIFEGLTNSGELARRFLEIFLPEVAEECKNGKHPATKYYIEP